MAFIEKKQPNLREIFKEPPLVSYKRGVCWTTYIMLGEFEHVVSHCWKRVESSLNRFKLSFNIDPTFRGFVLENVEGCWNRLNTAVQQL